MGSAFWRYQFILCLLFIFWGGFFVWGGLLNQLAFNYAIFYPIGFLVGYRFRLENIRVAYLSAFLFNCLTYLLAMINGIIVNDGILVFVDFASLFIFIKVGIFFGTRALPKGTSAQKDCS